MFPDQIINKVYIIMHDNGGIYPDHTQTIVGKAHLEEESAVDFMKERGFSDNKKFSDDGKRYYQTHEQIFLNSFNGYIKDGWSLKEAEGYATEEAEKGNDEYMFIQCLEVHYNPRNKYEN